MMGRQPNLQHVKDGQLHASGGVKVHKKRRDKNACDF
jgi:hypothetical protein